MYEIAKESYDKRKESGEALFAELNERFAEWYYVVPAETLDNLKLTRNDLVKVRETPPPDFDAPLSPGESQLPSAPNIEFPELPPSDPESGGDNDEKNEAPADEPDDG